MDHRPITSIVFFSVAVLVLTRFDYLVNAEFYNFGLQFSQTWYTNYTLLYNALFQIVIGLALFYSHNWRLAIIMEAFTLTCAQDIVYFGLWSGGVFPAGEWTWMSMYHIVGTWTTPMQIAFSTAITTTTILILQALKYRPIQLKLNNPLNSIIKPHLQPPTLINKRITRRR